MDSGIIRNLDSAGRIVLPAELRRALKWSVGSPIAFYLLGQSVLLHMQSDEPTEIRDIPSDNPIIQEAITALKYLSEPDFLFVIQLIRRLAFPRIPQIILKDPNGF